MKKLHNLTLQQYENLLNDGMLWVYYPHATGVINRDLKAVPVARKFDSTTRSDITFYDIRDDEAVYEI